MNKRVIPPPPFKIPSSVWHDTIQPIREAGVGGYECFVLWLGRVDCDRMHVQHAVVPKQVSSHVDAGCYVRVDGSELFRLSVLAHRRGTMICGQVHAHPDDAYHSDIDEASPFVALPGALSVVLPRFAEPPLPATEWAIFQLQEAGDWRPMTADQALGLD